MRRKRKKKRKKLTEFGKPNAIRKIDSFLDYLLHQYKYIIYKRIYIYVYTYDRILWEKD